MPRKPSGFEHALRAAVAIATLTTAGLAVAQDAQPKAGAGTTQRAPAAPAKGGGDQDLRQRVEQLEEQLVDMQVVIGTLESLARSGATAAAQPRPDSGASSAGFGGADSARLDGMETQIRALTAQVEQLASELRAGGQRRSDATGAPSPFPPPQQGASSYPPPQGASSYPPPQQGASPYPPPQGTASYPPPSGASADRFGSTTVTSDTSNDAIGGLITDNGAAPEPRPEQSSLPPVGGPDTVAAVDPAAAGAAGDPKQLYERAYGFLLQQDYTSAQAGFGDFLKRYPKDSLAPNALYWLGETHYVQRNFVDAAEAFDLVVASYSTSSKAPEAQLKRGMALAQLGKRKDACAVFRDLGTKYPSAPALVKSKVESEQQRVGCP